MNNYVDCAFEFMDSLDTQKIHPVVSMCFAEQRLLPMCAKERGKEIKTLLDYKKLDEQDFVTHLWGAKTQLNNSLKERERFCKRCIQRIVREFPQFAEVIISNSKLCEYFN